VDVQEARRRAGWAVDVEEEAAVAFTLPAHMWAGVAATAVNAWYEEAKLGCTRAVDSFWSQALLSTQQVVANVRF
jgi:hypothetical protein